MTLTGETVNISPWLTDLAFNEYASFDLSRPSPTGIGANGEQVPHHDSPAKPQSASSSPALSPTILDKDDGPVLNAQDSGMGPPPSKRAKKAPTLSNDAWAPHRERVLQLHVGQGLPLRDVRRIMENETGFTATERQYRTRISQWNGDKNIKPREMQAIVRKRQQRKLVEQDKPAQRFQVRGKFTTDDQIDRWMKRNGVVEDALYAPSPARSTPSAVQCLTISRDTTPRSPMLTTADSFPSPALASLRSPIIFGVRNSPALSDIAQSPYPAFDGQSPAPNSNQEIFGPTSAYPASESPRYQAQLEESIKNELSRLEALGLVHSTGYLVFLRQLTVVYTEQARYKKAVETLKEALVLSRGSPDLDSVTPYLLFDLGKVYRCQYYLEQAAVTYKKVLGLIGQSSTEEHILHSIATKNALADIYTLQWKTQSAERLLLSNLKYFEHASAPSMYMLASLINLAEVYLRMKLWDQSERTTLWALSMCKATLGVHHPWTCCLIVSQAKTYEGQARGLEAAQLLENTARDFEALKGPKDENTMKCWVELAKVYQRQGRVREAISLLTQALVKYTEVYGGEHPHTTTVKMDLAVVYAMMAHWSKAAQLGESAVQTFRKVIGARHASTLEAMTTLGFIYKEQGQWILAMNTLEAGVEGLQEIPRKNYATLQCAIGYLFQIYEKFGRWDDISRLAAVRQSCIDKSEQMDAPSP